MVSSGTTAKATVSDAVVTLIASTALRGKERNISISNESAVAGFFSIDNGNTWHRLPQKFDLERKNLDRVIHSILMKRVAGGADVTDVYASAW